MTIPTKYLSKMGDYDLTYDGVSLKAKVVDSSMVVDQLIPNYFGSEDIVGVDLKTYTTSSNGYDSSLHKFLRNPNICFVQASTYYDESIKAVSACELAARILKKPELMKEKSLEVVATQVGVPYQNVFGSCRESNGSIKMDSGYEKVLTQEQVKMVAYDAFKCHKIGLKLLSSFK